MSIKKKYYRCDKIVKMHPHYAMLLGQKSNGKSYAVKERALKNAWAGRGEFIYMRRFQMDVKPSDVCAYFADMPISSITDGEYTLVDCYKGVLYFARYDADTNKMVRGQRIGRNVYLSGYHHFASQAFPRITDIIFEEFITDGIYLDDEPTQLQKMVSTIARDNDVIVWLIGNTISRVCPYFQEWSLDKVVNQLPGTIDTYEFSSFDDAGNETITKICVEYCENVGSPSKMFFGKAKDHISAGHWQVKEYPKMPADKEKLEMLYELVFSDMGFRFVLQLFCDTETGGQFVFVYPQTKHRKILRVVSGEFSTDPFHTTGLRHDIYAEQLISKLISDKKICYSDNLTGSDFNNVIMNRNFKL